MCVCVRERCYCRNNAESGERKGCVSVFKKLGDVCVCDEQRRVGYVCLCVCVCVCVCDFMHFCFLSVCVCACVCMCVCVCVWDVN